MNVFERATISAIHRHGVSSTYKVITTGTYNPDTSSVTNSSTSYSVTIYKKQFIANQFQFPNLIGRETAMFYVCAADINFVPKAQDIVVFNSVEFTVSNVQSHMAEGKVILYKILGVK